MQKQALLSGAEWRAGARWIGPIVALLTLAAALPAAEVDRSAFDQSVVQGGEWTWEGGVLGQTQPTSGTSRLTLPGEARERLQLSFRVRVLEDEEWAEAGVMLPSDAGYSIFCSIWRGKGGWYAGIVDYGPYRYGRMLGDQALLAGAEAGVWQQFDVQVVGSTVRATVNGEIELAASFPLIEGKPVRYGNASQWDEQVLSRQQRVALETRNTSAEFDAITHEELAEEVELVTPLTPQYDATGRVLARWAYADVIGAFTDWFARCGELVSAWGGSSASYPLAPVMEETGWPPYVFSWATLLDDRGLDHPTQFPTHNGPPTISGFIAWYLYTGEERYREAARVWADWMIEQGSTPADSPRPFLPLSTYSYFGAAYTGDLLNVIEPDKASLAGLSYLELADVTGEEAYREAARRIAQTVAPLQQADGSFPFRLSLATGDVTSSYSCSQLWHVRFFERLGAVDDREDYRRIAEGALHWLLTGPVQNNQWLGFYGDMYDSTVPESYDQWTALEMAQWLIDHHADDPGYIEAARRILHYVDEKLTIHDGLHRGVPAVVEQTLYPVILPHHNMRLADTYARLYGATGDEAAGETALRISNSMTHMATADGKFRQGLNSSIDDLVCLILELNLQYLRVMVELPQTAPTGENHLLYHSGPLREIRYEPGKISLQALEPGQSILIVAGPVHAVTAETGELTAVEPPTSRLAVEPAGYHYESATGRLFVLHPAGRIEIQLE